VRSKKGDGWIGVTEAAEYLGVSRQAVFKATSMNRLRYYQVRPNAQIFLWLDDVVAYGRLRGVNV